MVYSEAKAGFMSNISKITPPLPDEITLNHGANVVEARNSRGKICQLIDNTGTIENSQLINLLNQLIQDEQFGINALSSMDGTLNIDKPRLSHIQIHDELYRLLLLRYQAVIEKF